MNDHTLPKKTLLGFLKFTYWDLPNAFFVGWALFWMYLLPAALFMAWQTGEKSRLAVKPRFEELSIVEGKAIFRTGRKALIIKLADGTEFVPSCRANSLFGGICMYNDEIAARSEGKAVKAWNHPIAGTLQVELNGTVSEGRNFEYLSRFAMDSSWTDFGRLLCVIYAISMLLFVPIFSLSKFFKSGE